MTTPSPERPCAAADGTGADAAGRTDDRATAPARPQGWARDASAPGMGVPCAGCARSPSALFASDLPARPVDGVGWSVVLAASSLDIRDALQRLTAHLATRGVDAEAIGDVELVLAEMMNNVAEHGYPPESCGHMALDVEVLPEALVCRLIDRGRALPGARLPGAALRDPTGLERQQLHEGGYGWGLIHALTDLIRYRRCGDCNCLAFVLRTPRGTPS